MLEEGDADRLEASVCVCFWEGGIREGLPANP